MIIVLDTNVWISGSLSTSGAPAEILKRWEENEFEIAISPSLLQELDRVLSYPRIARVLKFSEYERNSFIKYLTTFAIQVEPTMKLNIIKNVPDDNRVLECAVSGKASFIVTGDQHLLEIEEYQGIVILPPAGFIALLNAMSR